ncbi:hypothetical protein [Bradyrhizobium sp. Ash2021]|uniref:hypothetical protein n=1 Tax=Bradyrhizobium sp. Ash2021 TaxID=2954771 RepID=UPI0028165A01|nr:hypothetical protein [Bradyrhizobium sp. Ash2021]WMT72034.1 hypothetical protein NL528_28715 [Bradyrhizobium sp. Ash2021]
MRLQAGHNLKVPDYHNLSVAKTGDLPDWCRIPAKASKNRDFGRKTAFDGLRARSLRAGCSVVTAGWE